MIDVWVTGSSLPALDAALACAEVGLRVRVSLDEHVSLPHGPQRDPDGAIAALVARVGAPLPGDAGEDHPAPGLISRAPCSLRLVGVDGALHSLDATAVFGIPTSPLAESVAALLGKGGSFRAYIDRLRPLLQIGKEQRFGPLVRSRLGAQAERILTAPLVRERVGVSTDDVDTARLAPGLNEALTRVGSLTGAALAYGDRYVARETTVEPVGGWRELRAALLRRLALYSVELVEGRPVTALGRAAEGSGWLVRTQVDGVPTDEPVAAVVIDVSGAPRLADALGFAEDPALAKPSSRAYAEIGIERPSWLSVGKATAEASGVTPEAELPALRALPVATGANDEANVSGWMVRVEPSLDGWVARFAGPRSLAGGAAKPANLEALCAAAQVVPRTSGVPSATAWVDAAPALSVEDEHARIQAIRLFDEEHPTLRPVGSAWTGGDSALALAETMPRMVELRRRLLGIS